MTPPLPGGGLRKVRRGTFVQVPSSTIRDRRLSFRARGVLAWLLDKPDGWDVRATVIAEEGTEGREAVEGALRELRRLGYYRLERRRLPDGSFTMGTAVAEEPVDAWAASHEAHNGRAVPVTVKADGTVVEASPETGFQAPADPAPADRASAGQAPTSPPPTQTETQTERESSFVSGVRHQGGPAADATEAPAPAEVRACDLCDDEGTAVVPIPGPTVGLVVCTHDADRNRRAYEARIATRKALDEATRKRTTINPPDQEA